MPPKLPKASGGRNRNTEEEKEQILQAVVLADSFETKFAPFTLERPRCLLHLVNTPLIEYTLEYLASTGVHEVYLYAGAHVDQVEAYIYASKWKLNTSPFRKFIFLKTFAASVGDVLRDLDQRDLMAGDFLCVTGDIVSNIPLDEALRKHKERREKDKNAIMTMVLCESARLNHPSQHTITPTFVIDPSKDRCLHYEEFPAGQGKHLSIDPDMLTTPEIDIRQDLIDCRIDICTPAVLNLWADNFDNQSLRKDFLHGVLRDYELNGKTVHTYITHDYYASRISDLFSYDQTSVDILKRWASPFSVENNIFARMAYKHRRKGIFQESDVILARYCKLEGNTIIGEGSTVGAGTVIRNSVIGRCCHIGANSVIDGAFVWDEAAIGNEVEISKAIIANEASIGDGSKVAQGALISFGVRVGSRSSVSSSDRLTKIKHNGSDDGTEEDENISRQPSLIYKQPAYAASADTIDSEGSTEEELLGTLPGTSSRTLSMSENASDGEISNNEAFAFHREVVNTMFGRMQTNKEADDVKVELVSSRLSHNATPHMVRRAVAASLMKHIQTEVENSKGTPAEASKAAVERYHILITRENDRDSVDDQVDFLIEAQKDLVHRKDGGQILLFFTKELYDMEVFGEDVFMQWWEDGRSKDTSAMEQVRAPTSQFIDWLENAESESESDNDD